MSKYRISKVRFCPKNHDTLKVGRRYSGQCSQCDRDYRNKNRYKIRNINKKSFLKCTYGITPEQLSILIQKQNNKCAICKQTQKDPSKPLAIDHDHITGKVRGLLCNTCNLSLGLFNDSKQFLKAALEYLEETHVPSAV